MSSIATLLRPDNVKAAKLHCQHPLHPLLQLSPLLRMQNCPNSQKAPSLFNICNLSTPSYLAFWSVWVFTPHLHQSEHAHQQQSRIIQRVIHLIKPVVQLRSVVSCAHTKYYDGERNLCPRDGLLPT